MFPAPPADTTSMNTTNDVTWPADSDLGWLRLIAAIIVTDDSPLTHSGGNVERGAVTDGSSGNLGIVSCNGASAR